jgi:hypothetical protein
MHYRLKASPLSLIIYYYHCNSVYISLIPKIIIVDWFADLSLVSQLLLCDVRFAVRRFADLSLVSQLLLCDVRFAVRTCTVVMG